MEPHDAAVTLARAVMEESGEFVGALDRQETADALNLLAQAVLAANWMPINKLQDAPDHDCLVAYSTIDQWATGDRMDDPGNLGAGVGYLSWSKDKSYWSIVDDGEVIVPSQVAAVCEIPMPNGITVGVGALPDRS